MSKNDKGVMPTKKKIREWWQSSAAAWVLLNSGLSDDVASIISSDSAFQPMCWCCGSRGVQERAHIKATALGGDNSIENIFLLCNTCHTASPDYSDSHFFYKWVNRNCGSGFTIELEETTRIINIMMVKIGALFGVIEIHDAITSAFYKNMSFASSSMGSHGGNFQPSTRFAMIEDCLTRAIDSTLTTYGGATL